MIRFSTNEARLVELIIEYAQLVHSGAHETWRGDEIEEEIEQLGYGPERLMGGLKTLEEWTSLTPNGIQSIN